MKKYILRNRHSLLLSVVAACFVLMLLEAGLTGRELFSLEVDNSFFQLKINESLFGEELDVLDGFGIDIDF